MAVSYPRSLVGAGFGVGQTRFVLRRADLQAPESSGVVGGVQMGWPRWQGEWEVTCKSDAEMRAVEAWVASLRGGIKTFIGSDLRRLTPAAYPSGVTALTRHGGGAFDGSATSFSLSGDRATLTLNGLPSTLAITAGDFIDFRWTTGGAARRHLVQALESVTASAGVAAFDVDPAVHSVVPTSGTPAVAWVQACGTIMRLTSETEIGGSSPEGYGQVKIVGVEDIRA